MKIQALSITNSKSQNSYNVNHSSKRQVSFQALNAVIFDADGTMVKTGRAHFLAWSMLYFRHPSVSVSKFYRGVGQNGTTKATVERIYKDLITPQQVDAYVNEKEDFFLKMFPNVKQVKGLSGFVDSVSHIKRAIATCADPKIISHYLEKINLTQQFEPRYIIDSSAVSRVKPDPEVYQKVLSALGESAENAVAFEDSQAGIAAAVGAGLKVVGVATGSSKKQLIDYGASLAIKDFTEIDLAKLQDLVK